MVEPAPTKFKEGGQTIVDELREIILGTDEDPKLVFASTLLTLKELGQYEELLKECRDVLAWSYPYMPRLDTNVVVHQLAISSEMP